VGMDENRVSVSLSRSDQGIAQRSDAFLESPGKE
jgi:hypothetical protein